MCVHGHEVIIAVTRAEVTPRHNFVIPSRQRSWMPRWMRFDKARCLL
jgi:hypothetical protein